MKTTFVSGLGIAAMALASSVAHAGHEDGFGTVSANIGVASEYIFRGLPSSNNAAQVSGGVDWTLNNYYLGTWMSNVGNDTTGNEVDLYGGVTVGDFDLGLIAYTYPGETTARESKNLEAYVGYNKGMFSGYAWYGLGATGRSNNDYIYLEGNLTAPVSDAADLSIHVGYTIYHGSDFDNNHANETDEQVDLGLKLSLGNLWFGMTTILDNDTNEGLNKRPRVNIGYTWTFDDVMNVRLN